MIIDELIALLGFETKGEHELRRFNDGLDRAERKAQAVANRINAMSVAVGTFLGQVAVQLATRVGGAIGSLPGDIIGVGATFEQLETTLTTIEGSSDKAKAALDWVTDFAATTTYDLGEVAEAFVRMRAYGLDPMSGQLEGIGNAASAMGKSLMQGVEAIADAVTGENERLKEFGIRAKAEGDKITYTWQQNGETMTKTVKKDGTEIIRALLEIFGRFDGAMEEQSKTWKGMVSNALDQWTIFLKSIGDAGYYEDVKRRFRDMMDVVDQWRKDGLLDRTAQAISNFLTRSMFLAERVGRVIWDIGKAAFYAAKGMVELISKVTGLNTAASAGVLGAAVLGSTPTGRAALAFLARRIPALAAFVVIEDILSALRGDDSYIGKLEGGQEAIDKLSESFRKLAEAMAAIEPAWQAMVELDFFQFINQSLLEFINDLSRALRELAIIARAIAQGDWRLAGSMLLFGADEEKLDRIEEYQKRQDRQSQSGEAAPAEGMDVPRSSSKGGRVTAPRPERFQSGEVAPVDGMDALRTALENYQANAAKLGASANAVIEDNRVQTDARNQSINVGSPNVTVNVQEAVQAPAAVGQAVGRAVGQAAVPPRAQLNTEPSF